MDIKDVVMQRRTVVRAGGMVAAGAVLAACSSGGSSAASSAPSQGASAAPAGSPAGSAGTGGTALTNVADVPVGGGVIVPDAAVVVTQPQQGTVKAFTAICPHQGCLVGSVENNEIICPCHGSRFSAEDGSVIQGPAEQPLAPEQIAVDNGTVMLKA